MTNLEFKTKIIWKIIQIISASSLDDVKDDHHDDGSGFGGGGGGGGRGGGRGRGGFGYLDKTGDPRQEQDVYFPPGCSYSAVHQNYAYDYDEFLRTPPTLDEAIAVFEQEVLQG